LSSEKGLILGKYLEADFSLVICPHKSVSTRMLYFYYIKYFRSSWWFWSRNCWYNFAWSCIYRKGGYMGKYWRSTSARVKVFIFLQIS